MGTDLPRKIGFWGAFAVVVGVTIGSGIFAQPPEIARHLGSPGLILALWALGGVLALCGAMTYAELAAMHPHTGGIYVFLREGLGRPVAFVFGWTYMLITKPFAAAGIGVIFSEHLLLLIGARSADPHTHQLTVNSVTTALLIVLTIVNVIGVRASAGVATVLTTLKVASLGAIVALAVVLVKGSAANLESVPPPKPFLIALAPVMLAVMWTYDGWSDVGSIAGEIREPQRMLPRVYLLGTAAITMIYLAVNAVYLWVVPLHEMRGLATIGPAVMERLIGPAGGVAVAAIVVVSTLGSSHASVLTGARVTFAQARDGLLFRVLARVHPRFETPSASLWFQLAMSVAALWYAGGFAALANTFTFTMWIFYGLAGLSIFVLRIRRPDAPRPFRCLGYPVVPGIFIAAAAAITALTIAADLADPQSRGMSTLPWLAVLGTGIPMYYLWRRFSPPTKAENHRAQ